jgi:MtN3 and saliva related transmembrane protein
MLDFNYEIIGLIAAAITTSAFIPQVYKVYKEKNSVGISLTMYLIFIVGLSIWLFYGFLIGSISIIIANGVTLILAAIIIYYKLKNL